MIRIEEREITELVPYKNNPRKNDAAIKNVVASIKNFGFKVPIVIDKNNIIVCGHTRYKAAQELKLNTVPCIIADDLTPEQIKGFRLADNKTAEMAEWDFSALEIELQELSEMNLDFDMSDFGFDLLEFENPKEIIEDDVPIVDEENESVCKIGDIWQLGRHRLMCGDSTDKESVEKLMNGEMADMVFTDPPYGMKKEKDGILNDNLNFDELLEFNKKWIPLTFNLLKDMGGWYCWGIDEPLMDIYSEILKPLAKQNKIVIRNYITWAKHSAIGMKSPLMLSYPKETEKCWFVVKGRYWGNTNAEFFNYKYQKLLDYLNEEAQKINLDAKKLRELTGVQMWAHWFSKSQFTVIPQKHYETLQKVYAGKAFLLSYEELRALIGCIDNKKKPHQPYFDLTWFDNGDMPLSDVWRESITSQKERELVGNHATPKPLKICERAICTSSKKNEIICDLFGGSGSTLISCEQLGRRCFMMELDPKYCDVIIKRWEILTGGKAEKVDK
nr:MAG TPA: adenine specific DNA methyltransferase [Caudoviricetes sp.]